jgi:hypothetical protein
MDLSVSTRPHRPPGPACFLQRTGSLWQLGIESQELTTAIAQLAEAHNKAALAAKADATCWVIEHLRGQAAYRQQSCAAIRGGRDETART